MCPTITRIRVRNSFPAAHRIRIDDHGTYEPVHVHHWRVVALFEASSDKPEAAAQEASVVIGDWVRRHRGRSLNDVAPFDQLSPTAEEVARQMARRLAEELPSLRLIELTIGEAAGFSATYHPC